MSAFQCPICFESFSSSEPTAECPADRRPTIMPGLCGRSICMSCAESYRVTQREQLQGDDNMIQCMFCKIKFHSVDHVFYPTRNLIEIIAANSNDAKTSEADSASSLRCNTSEDADAGHAAHPSVRAASPSSQRSDRQMHKRIKLCGVWGDYYGGVDDRGARHGHGSFKWDDGDKYNGEWQNGERHGHGTFTHARGAVYDGDWKEGIKHGQGMYTFAGGAVYNGEYKDSKREGRGRYTSTNGSVYLGDWTDNKREGRGTESYASGNMYEGEFKDNKKEGRGRFTWVDCNVYEEEYKDGKMEGRGRYTWANGNMYDGDWKDDKREGCGTFAYTDGRIEVRQYRDGDYAGKGARWSADRQTAWRLQDGEQQEEISLEAASAIAVGLGQPVPR